MNMRTYSRGWNKSRNKVSCDGNTHTVKREEYIVWKYTTKTVATCARTFPKMMTWQLKMRKDTVIKYIPYTKNVKLQEAFS